MFRSLKRERDKFLKWCTTVGYTHIELPRERWGEIAFTAHFPDKEFTDEYRELFTMYPKMAYGCWSSRLGDNTMTVAVLSENRSRMRPHDILVDIHEDIIYTPGEIYVSSQGDVSYVWVQEGEPLIKHVVTSPDEPERVTLFINGISMFDFVFRKVKRNFTGWAINSEAPPVPTPATAQRHYMEKVKEGFKPGSFLTDIAKPGLFSLKNKNTLPTLQKFLSDDALLADYCLNKPVQIADAKLLLEPEDFMCNADYELWEEHILALLVKALKEESHLDLEKYLAAISYNKTVPESLIRRMYTITPEQSQALGGRSNWLSAYGGFYPNRNIHNLIRREDLSTETLHILLGGRDEWFNVIESIDEKTILHPNFPLSVLLERYPVFKKKFGSSLPRKAFLNQPASALENLITQHGVEIEPGLLSKEILTDFLMNVLDEVKSDASL